MILCTGTFYGHELSRHSTPLGFRGKIHTCTAEAKEEQCAASLSLTPEREAIVRSTVSPHDRPWKDVACHYSPCTIDTNHGVSPRKPATGWYVAARAWAVCRLLTSSVSIPRGQLTLNVQGVMLNQGAPGVRTLRSFVHCGTESCLHLLPHFNSDDALGAGVLYSCGF